MKASEYARKYLRIKGADGGEYEFSRYQLELMDAFFEGRVVYVKGRSYGRLYLRSELGFDGRAEKRVPPVMEVKGWPHPIIRSEPFPESGEFPVPSYGGPWPGPENAVDGKVYGGKEPPETVTEAELQAEFFIKIKKEFWANVNDKESFIGRRWMCPRCLRIEVVGVKGVEHQNGDCVDLRSLDELWDQYRFGLEWERKMYFDDEGTEKG